MERYVRAFLKSSLAWLAVGAAIGVTMTLRPEALVYRPAHLHANLLGFVVLFISGVAYHVLPRFTGHPVFSGRLAVAQLVLANTGLLALEAGFLLLGAGRPHAAALALGGVASGAGLLCFVVNAWGTLDGWAATGPSPRVAGAAGRRLPVAGE